MSFCFGYYFDSSTLVDEPMNSKLCALFCYGKHFLSSFSSLSPFEITQKCELALIGAGSATGSRLDALTENSSW